MKKDIGKFIIVLLLVLLFCELVIPFVKQIYSVKNPDGTLSASKIQQAIENIYNSFQPKQFNYYALKPTENQIGESQLVLYSSVTTHGRLYTIINGATFYIQLTAGGG